MKGWVLVLWIGCALVHSAHGMFMWQQTEKVPIQRLFTNIEARLARDKNDFENTYRLARLHSMAYAVNPQTLEATKKDTEPVFGFPGSDAGVPNGVRAAVTPAERQSSHAHLTNAILLYERALVLLKKTTNEHYQYWGILPVHLGYAWCLDQAGRTNDALIAYRKTLRIAWKMEVTGEFKLKEWLSERWDDIKAGQNPFGAAKARQRSLGPGVCYSEETMGYMLKLLDPLKDAKEIAELRENRKVLSKMGRAITPIVVPLEPDLDLADCIDADSAVEFDLDGTGIARRWGWLTPRAAWLVFDDKGGTPITSAVQMFGNVMFWIFWRNGYQALRALDADGDGTLRGSELEGLALWHDENGNGICEPGEVRSVTEYGITEIQCTFEEDALRGSWNPKGIVFLNGTSRPTFDWVAHGKD